MIINTISGIEKQPEMQTSHSKTSSIHDISYTPHESVSIMNRFSSLRFTNNETEVEDADIGVGDNDCDSDDNKKRRERVKQIVPGIRNYNEVTRDGPNTVVFSTSITKGIGYSEFNERITGQANFRRFHGHKVRHIKEYVWTHLEELSPSSAIIQMGGNDLPTPKDNPVPVIEIANHIIETGIICRNYGVQKICIGSVTPRKQHYTIHRRKELNDHLQQMCKVHKFIYIDNSEIGTEHLYDGVHLTDEGSNILRDNYLDALNASVVPM